MSPRSCLSRLATETSLKLGGNDAVAIGTFKRIREKKTFTGSHEKLKYITLFEDDLYVSFCQVMKDSSGSAYRATLTYRPIHGCGVLL